MAPPRVAVGGPDAERVTDIVGRAFQDDPVWSFVFPDDHRRQQQYAVFWRLMVDGAMRHDTVWLAAGDVAAAVWLPPGAAELTDHDEARFESLMSALMGDHLERLLETVHRFEQARPLTPHYYLSLLATDPRHAGHGLGMALLEANLRHVDATGLPAYLESTNPANLDRYRRLGFAAFETFALPDSGPTVTQMWREPPRAVDSGQPSV